MIIFPKDFFVVSERLRQLLRAFQSNSLGIFLEHITKAPIFNLNGVRLKYPRKGINIVDGKKVLKH